MPVRTALYRAATQAISCLERRQLQIGLRGFSSESMADLTNHKVEHDTEKKEFYINIGQERALLQYNLDGDVYDLVHTFTPPALRGSGIAKVLAHKAFDHVVDSGAKMKLTCEYLEYLNNKEQNIKYKSHIVK